MIQNTPEWHAWRSKGIGASESPVIMGVSPYLTPFQLWEQKLGLKSYDQTNPATQLGQYFEKEALDIFNKKMEAECFPSVQEHPEFNFIRASLDGDDPSRRIFVEIKYMGKKNFENVKAAKAPLGYHHPQVQQQFLVTGYHKAFYMAYILNEEKSKIEDSEIVQVQRDDAYIDKLLYPKLKEFWSNVTDQVAPPLSQRDEVIVVDELSISLVRKLVNLNEMIEKADKERELIKKSLKTLTDKHPRIVCDNMVIYVQHRKGSIDYEQIPQLKGLDLNPYRKPPTKFVSFRSRKE